MKKLISLTLISLIIAWIIIVASNQSFNLLRNQQFFEIENKTKINKNLYLLTISKNEDIRIHLLHILKNNGCALEFNKLTHNNSTVEIWEINCEK